MRFFIRFIEAAIICAVWAPAFAAAPSITGFTPSTGPIGTRLTITGTAFTGATKVTIGAASTAHPGAKVTFTASGLDAYASMEVFFDSTDVALMVSNGSGIATATITLPGMAAPAGSTAAKRLNT